MGAAELQGGGSSEQPRIPTISELLQRFDEVTLVEVQQALSLQSQVAFAAFLEPHGINNSTADLYFGVPNWKMGQLPTGLKSVFHQALIDKSSGRFPQATAPSLPSGGIGLSLKQILGDLYSVTEEELVAALQFCQVPEHSQQIILHYWNRSFRELAEENESYAELLRVLKFKNWDGFLESVTETRDQVSSAVKISRRPPGGSFQTEQIPRPASVRRGRLPSDTEATLSADDIRRVAEQHKKNLEG